MRANPANSCRLCRHCEFAQRANIATGHERRVEVSK